MDGGFKIDFIGVGFPRCGTTWISRCLREHPEICFSNKKEVHFFNNDVDYEKGVEHYKTFFNQDDEKVVGEFTPEYYIYKKTYDRIRKDYPNAKLIFSLRNPVERAFSHYLYRKRRTGREYPIGEIFSQEDLPIEEQILYPGFYYHHLKRWLKDLPSDQYLILIHEDHKKDPELFMRRIYKFLGVDDSFVAPSINKQINKSAGLKYRFKIIQKIYSYHVKLKRKNWFKKVVDFLKKLGLNKISARIVNGNYVKNYSGEKEVLSEAMRDRIKAAYNDDIKKLEELLGRDLSFWK